VGRGGPHLLLFGLDPEKLRRITAARAIRVR
jgi:hypothetical protein